MRRSRRSLHPSDRAYLRLMRKHARQMEIDVRAALLRAIDRGDAAVPDEEMTQAETVAALRRLVQELAKIGVRTIAPSTISEIGRRTAKSATRIVRRSLLRLGASPRILAARLGLDGVTLSGVALRLSPGEEHLLEQWAMEGSGYIARAQQELFDRLPIVVPQTVLKGAQEGSSWRTIADVLSQKMKGSRARMELIARDQTARLNGRITEHLQTKAGVKEYTWRSSHDQRVRPTHRAADGNRYAWAGPGAPNVGFYGESGHPGQVGNCRCTAEPVMPDDWLG